MIHGAKGSTHTLDSFSDTIQSRHRKVQEMDTQENDHSTSEVTHQLVNGQIRLAI